MNNEEARFILAAYRPGGQDAGDPRFAEALRQAQIDPQLQAWFVANLEYDAGVAAALRGQPAPPDLKTSILAGHKLAPMPRVWNRSWLAAAAALMLLGVIAAVIARRHLERPSFATLQRELPAVMASFEDLEMKTSDLGEIRAYLASQGAHGDLQVPKGLGSFPSLGCRVLEWHERKITLICFRLGEPVGQVAHLLVMDPRDLRDAPDTQPIGSEQGTWSTAGWRDKDHVYLLATAAGGAPARSLLTAAF